MRYREPGIHIQSYEVIPDELGGSLDAWWGQAIVHVKAQDGDMPFMVANELICCRLAAALGLPVLPGELATHPESGRLCWATPQVKYGGVTPPPALPADILELYSSTAAGALVFDCWVLNEDRHDENFLFHPNLGMWLIDHEHSLAGRDGSRFEAFEKGQTASSISHCFRGQVLDVDDVEYWVRRVRSIPVNVIDLALNEANARRLISKQQVNILRKMLVARRETISSLVAGLVGKPPAPGSDILEQFMFPSS